MSVRGNFYTVQLSLNWTPPRGLAATAAKCDN